MILQSPLSSLLRERTDNQPVPPVFGEQYSGLYDSFYYDKDYSRECDLLERIFARQSERAIDSVLDLGCGTGGHAFVLSQRDYRVVGVDRSPAMVEKALDKAKGLPAAGRPTFHVGDLRDFRGSEQFDAVLMMFAVLGYQIEDDDVRSAFATARHHLRPGGLLVFDCWHGPAVDSQLPGPRTKVVNTATGRITRSSSTVRDTSRHCCHITFRVHEEGGSASPLLEETHRMRYFYREELEAFAAQPGLALLRLDALPLLDRPADEASWNVMGVARLGGD